MASARDDLERLLAEAPFVHALARSLVADDADDIVQQAYARALADRPRSIPVPRRWLSSIVRNLVVDRARARRRAATRERRAAAAERVPSPLELLQLDERRRALLRAVDALPGPQRTVVLLRYYEGLPPRRIAAELGVSVTTVSNRLHKALQALRGRLDAEHGGERRAWLLPLVPFAAPPRALPWREVATGATGAHAVAGMIGMTMTMTTITMKTKLAAAAVLLLAVAAIWAVAFPPALPDPAPAADRSETRPLSARVEARPPRDAADPVAERTALPAPLAAGAVTTTGDLVVHVRFPDEPATVADVPVLVHPVDADFRMGVLRGVTDASGSVRFDGLRAGRVTVRTPGNGVATRAELVAGEVTDCRLDLTHGYLLEGVVVDDAGTAVGGASIEISMASLSIEAKPATTTAADGTFSIRHVNYAAVVGARAERFAASALHLVQGDPGDRRSVRIELHLPGGVVVGSVADVEGRPVPDAVVRVGDGNTDCINVHGRHAPPLPAQVVTDAEGRFRTFGVPLGTQPLQVRATGLAPWRGTCEVVAGRETPVAIVLSDGATCAGVVLDDAREPVADATVAIGAFGDFVQMSTRSAADGSFRIDGAPVGKFDVTARSPAAGSARATLFGISGRTVDSELVLTRRGLTLRGRVVDEANDPLEKVCVESQHGRRFGAFAWTDAEGRFVVHGQPAGKLLTLRFVYPDRVLLVRDAVDPRAGELLVTLPRDTAPKAIVRGLIFAPDGRPADDVDVAIGRFDPQSYEMPGVGPDGSFSATVPAGSWWLRIEHQDHPTIAYPPRPLASGETWDLGSLRLTDGGRLVVRPQGETDADFLVFDDRARFVCGVVGPEGRPPQSELLAPGGYRLCVRGEGVAAQLVPFSIRAGEHTELQVDVAAGVRQRFRFTAPPEVDPSAAATTIELRRGDQAVAWFTTGGFGGQNTEWLTPGDYTLRTVRGPLQGHAAFTVTPDESSEIRLALVLADPTGSKR